MRGDRDDGQHCSACLRATPGKGAAQSARVTLRRRRARQQRRAVATVRRWFCGWDEAVRLRAPGGVEHGFIAPLRPSLRL
eukprot:500739-Prymnesium_polylepis.2